MPETTASPPLIHDLEPLEIPSPPRRRMTEEEFVEWCRGFENLRAEWVDGEVVVMSPVNLKHLRLSGFLLRVMADFVDARDLGEVNGAEYINRFRAGSRLLRRLPDVFFIAKDRLNLLQPTYLDGAPDLVVEIVSPDSTARDWREKYLDYEAAGVREYWIIDPLSKILEVSRREGEAFHFQPIAESEGRVASEILPGFYLQPAWLWQEPLPKVRDVLRELGAL
jgi:Uma2 family endonuclease